MKDKGKAEKLYSVLKNDGYDDIGEDGNAFYSALNPDHENAEAETAPQPMAQETIPAKVGVQPEPMQVEPVEGFGEGFKQGWKGMKEGMKYFSGEVANLFTGSGEEETRALKRLEEMQASGNVGMLATWSGDGYKGADGKQVYVPAGAEREDLDLIAETVKETGGDIDKAKRILAERAEKEHSWGDEMKASAAEGMKQMRPTKGFGAWVGNLAPQMIPSAAAIVLSVVTKNPKYANMIGGVGMGGMTASTAGQSMMEARQAGASNAQTWAVGITDGVIEFATEKIPFDNYTKRLFNGVKKDTGKKLAEAVTESSSPVRAELERLLTKANKKLGGKLLSGKNAKDYITSIAAEGASEFTAEALQTITPMIYENPEDYPSITEILSNGWEGAKAGLFMGAALGGASKIAEHHEQRSRRKEQGYVDVAQVYLDDNDDLDVVEVVGQDENTGNLQVLHDGRLKEVKRGDVRESHRFSFEEFDKGALDAEVEESYNNGYSLHTAEEMNDAKNMYDYQRERMKSELGVNDEALADGAVDWIGEVQNAMDSGTEEGKKRADTILDYLNAKQVRDGMIQRVRDDIDARVEQSNAMVDARTNRTTGMIQGATMKQNDRRVYVVGGKLVQYEDKSGIDNQASDGSIIVCDAETGKLEQVSPESVFNMDEPLNPLDEKYWAAEAIRQQYAQQEADKMDGKVTFNQGDTYAVTGEDGKVNVTVTANAQGIVDNGDGTVNVSDGANVFAMSKETIQQAKDAEGMARVVQFEQQRQAGREQAEVKPQLKYNDEVTLTDDNGNVITGNIQEINDDGVLVDVEDSITGMFKPAHFKKEKLEGRLVSVKRDGKALWNRPEEPQVQVEQPQAPTGTGVNTPVQTPVEPQPAVQAAPAAQPKDPGIPAMQRIPKDEQGNPLYEQADSDTAWDAIVEQTDGNEAMAQTVADGMVADKEAALKKLEKTKSKGGNSIAEKIASEKERKAAIDAAKAEFDIWKKIAGTANRRKMDADAERKRIADEAKNDLRGIMYQSIFKGGSVRLEEMFNALPVKAQKAILATAFRDYDSPNAERMAQDIQNSIRAYYALSQDKLFTEAKNFKEARIAVESWKCQYQIDDATGESYLPSDNFSNFALLLATMYKGESQSIIQSTFNKIYDLIQGTQEATLFEQPDNTPRTLAQAIYETLNIINDGQQRSNVLVDNTATSQRGQQGSRGDAQAGERVEDGSRPADGRGGIETDSGLSQRNGTQEAGDIRQPAQMDEEARRESIRLNGEQIDTLLSQMREQAEVDPTVELTPTTWNERFGESGFINTPLGNVKMGENQIAKFFAKGRGKEFGMVAPTLSNPDVIIEKKAPAANAERESKLLFIKTFIKADGSRYVNFESVTVQKDGMEVSISSHEVDEKVVKKEMQNGNILHLRIGLPFSSEWYLTETPIQERPDLVPTSDNNVSKGKLLYRFDGGAQTEQRPADVSVTTSPENLQGISDNKDTNNSVKSSELGEKIAKAEAEVDVNPTDKQKEAGNYKKGHVQVGVFDITIEQPKGSVRSGVDANGNKWETTMQNTYGYIRGTEGVDGDHIDVFLSDDIDGWNGRRVFVVDQYNEDGSFDEHKVMLGFNSQEDAEAAYFANYDKDWAKKHKTVVTPVNLEDFEKWVDSSHRKTKAFAEYKSVKTVEGQNAPQKNTQDNVPYTITPVQYTTKKGKVLDMYLVTLDVDLGETHRKLVNASVKGRKGWWDREKGGYMMRSYEDAELVVEYAMDLHSQPPLSKADLFAVNDGEIVFTEPQQTKPIEKEQTEQAPVWQYSISVDKETGYTTLTRDDVSGPVPIGDGRFRYTADSPEEMLELIRNPKNFGQEVRDAVETSLSNRVEIRKAFREMEEKNKREREAMRTNGVNGFRIGEEVTYKGKKAKIYDFEEYGSHKPVLDTGLAPVVYEVVEWSDIEKVPQAKEGTGEEKKQLDAVEYRGEMYRIGDEVVLNGLRGKVVAINRLKMPVVQTEHATIALKYNGTDELNHYVEPKGNASGNRLVTDERYAELRERMRKKLGGQMNMGIDPEILAIGTEMAVYHLEKGARKFADYAKVMITDLGDAIRPYLKAFYNGARDLPEVAGMSADMTSYEDVQKFDVANFDKADSNALATAETVAREAEVEQEAEIAKQRIKKTRSSGKKTEKKTVNSQKANGLFDGLIDNDKPNENGRAYQERAESTGAQREGNNQNGNGRTDRRSILSPKDGNTGASVHVEQGGVDGNIQRSGDDGRGNSSLSGTQNQPEAQRSGSRLHDDAVTKPNNTRNNHSERGKDHAPASVDARIEANIKAIELAKQLLESGEKATEKQMQTLRKFSGWGGLGKAFSEGTYYAPNNIAKKLRELLGEKAYQEAVMSANSAYYTPAYVVDTLWDIAEKMGFEGGNILEGSAGIGNILGQMPTHISERSDIHAIEIDGTSGGILSLLYPDAKVEIQGFEQTRIPNGSVDLAITNVPFVTGLRVNDTTGDKDLSKKFHNIHDFCIAKNVRKLREGGLGIFITSNGTLDNSKKLRDWIVSEGGADFVGAFRMHNKTFGGTGVTSDIVVIRKRVNGQKSAHAIDVSDVSGERMAGYDTGETRKVKGKETPVIKQLSMDYNRYFIEHPENMAGEMHFAFEKGDTFRPTSKGLYPKLDKKQEEMLAEFARSFRAEEFGERNTEVTTDAMPGKKIGEVFVKDGKLYINSTASAQPLEVNANKVKGHTKVECFEAYTAIKEALAEVLSYQTENESDNGLKPLLDKLNKAYDDFVSTYGHFNKNTAIAFLRNDVDYANVFALEKFEETADEKGNRIQKFDKTDVFRKRVVEKEKEPTPANVKDGIIASIFKFGRVDIPYIAEQLGTGIEDVKKEILENGYGFENPVSRQMEASYQYLSGNIREKLSQAEENNENGEFDRNIKALQEVMPMEIPAHLIDFTLGSSWIDPKLYEDFVKERTEVDVRFTAVGGTWFMKEPYFTNYEKNRAMGVTSEMLGRTIMGHTLIEAAIQNRSITVSTTKKNWDGSTETITDKEATQACAAKIDEIRQDFKDWARQKMQSDPEMSERMERIYNDMFNNFVPMSIPDEFVPEYFGGASHKFKMRPHQGRAIVKGTQQPLLLAHEVGTGKTFTLISTAMEMRRLGTARKPMIVVQNATVGQFVASAKELYPNAKILTLEEADRSAEGRKNFYAKIRYNDWDMIVVPQSTFEFIPDSEEREMAFVQDKIEEKMLILEKMKEEDPDGKNMITRQAEREIALLEEQLAGLADNASKKRTANDEKKRAVALQNAEVKAMEMLDRRTDDVENFDDMGIDALLVDEAHEYKHLGFATVMQRGVKGVDPSYSKKSQGVFLKTQAVLEKNNGRNVIFATGTPISNTAAEIWTFMRYLMPADTMKEYGIYYFDDFVRNFGNIQQMLEFTTSGKFKENNRFAGYVNLPELVRIWSGVSDTVLTKEAGGVKDKIPEMEGGKAQDLYLPQTRALRSIMKFVKSELEHYEQMSGKEKKENSHIPLTMYGIAKAAAVDARLVQSDAEDDPNSKTNEAVRQTLRSLKETADYKGTVAIFADNYQNKQSGFNLYDDIRNKLIAEGVPADEIVVMRSGMTVKKKLEIFEKVNRGEVRVILGSTFTLGTGVNIQERLHTLIHLDAPNRPMDYTQRNGRILRQGNLHKDMNKPVRILRFGVEDSLDVTAYQRLKTKGAIADSIMNGKQMMNNSMTNRVLEEEEDVFGDTVAQLSGSEYAMLKNNAEKNVRKYASRKKQWETDQTYIHNAKPRLKAFIKDAEKRIEDNGRYLEAVRSLFPDGQFKEIVTGKHRFASVDTMDDFFKEHNKSILAEMKQMKDGEISGEQKRELIIQIGDFSFVVTTKLTRKTMSDGATLFNDVERRMTYSCLELGIEDVPVRQNLLRNAIEDITDNVITGKDFAERLSAGERSKKHNEAELKELLSREGKPFEYEEELAQAKAQLEEYAELMKKELEEKEAKYAEMDASVKTANDITNTDEDDVLYRSDDTMYRIREDAAPQNTGIGYKVFVLKNGELYPPMVANPNGEATPVGVWLDADAAPIAGQSKTGRNQVKAGGKGTQGGSGKLAYRPGWHLGVIPYALQFNRIDENGDKTLFPANFVWAEVEYANDVDYQEEAMSYGYNKNGKFQHSYAGLPRIPENGAYTYRTNPNPETDPWIITGAMRVKRLLTPSEVDEMVKEAGREPQRRQENAVTDAEIAALNTEIANDYRNGIGTYTDDEVSYENDPVAKLLGQSRRTAKQRREFAQRERQRMAERVESLAEKLHLDNVEVVTDASVLDGKKQRAKGFYSKSTGKITIVIPNHTSTFDVEQTLLHEAVAHYGLRQLFGEHFDTFLDNVFNNAEESIRRRIVDMAAKNGWDFRKATEEYLASLAEDTEFENINANWWRQIKDFFLNMLHKIGFEDFRGVTLTDNELRYILWRSYENLKEPGRYRSILGEAADVAKQYELKVGNYAVDNQKNSRAADDTLFRDGDPEIHERVLARDRYEMRVKSGMFQSQEALQDSMLGLKEAMTAILGKRTNVEDVDGFENAYLGENRLSSVNKAEADAFAHTLFKPMLDEVAKLSRTEAEREELTDYMMAKHGLERNIYMRNEAINNGATDADQTDYAGLTALTGMDNVADAEAEAQLMIDDYEQAHDTTNLWEKVNAVSKAILSKSYECGMMSKSTFDKISNMYDFYIPLRGFDEKTSSEAYAYLTHKQSAFNAPIKKAEGRRSKADDPFSNLQSMAEGAIMQGNRNKLVKQRFLNFTLNHPSDLVSVSDIWVEYDTVSDEWKPVFPDNIDSTNTSEEVERKMLDFETKMESLAQQYPDRYKHGKDTVNIPYRIVESRDMRQHQIVVKRGGRDYVITINGNPRAAQALNGQTNPDNDMSGAIGAILRAGENINRQLSAFYTTRNPDFIVSNFMRDMLYTNTMTWIRESPNYALRFHRNYMYANPVRIKQLLAKHRKGTLDMGNKTEAMFHQFMMNGGETGYANIRDIEQHKNDIRRELKKSNGKIPVKKAWDLLGERFDEYNRAVENSARFAAFMTSREMGRSIDRAIYDAKEISVNFNKKGSGAKFYDSTGQTKTGNASALVSGLGRSGYVFWNAAIQGTANFGRQMKRHPAKAFTGIAAMFLLGAIVAYLGGDDDDDDDKNAYYNLPEYVRRSNILFRAGDSWVSIPLPVEYKAVYGMGELMISVLNGKEHLTDGEIAEAIAGQATQILPIDFLEGGGGLNAFVPSAYKPLWEAYVAEKSWTGMPLYKNTPWNKDMPEWTKAYKSANKYIVGLANVMNEATGGDPYTKGAIDLNPAKIEYMLNGYFGGVFGTIDKLSKTAETIAGDREYDPRSILLVNRLVKAGDERTEYRAVNNEYFRLKEEHDRLKSRLKHYEEDTDNGIFDYAEKIDFLYNSPEYLRYEIFEEYQGEIDALYDELKITVDGEERKVIEAELNSVKEEMIEKINQSRKQ